MTIRCHLICHVSCFVWSWHFYLVCIVRTFSIPVFLTSSFPNVISMSRNGALWIGGLESYMDESFLQSALEKIGQNNVISIKVMRNKFTGEPASYGFVNFDNDHQALMAMHKLNGKVVPNTNPPVRFKLNHQSTRLNPGEPDLSIWVGDLTPEVDDLELYKFFAGRFDTVRTAKVVLDNNGYSKGYGFIRFGCEKEQQTALCSMMGVSGLGQKPIRVSVAVAKSKGSSSTMTSSIEPSTASAIASMVTGGNQAAAAAAALAAAAANPNSQESADYSQYWHQYWSQYAAWNQYSSSGTPYDYEHQVEEEVIEEPSEYELMEHSVPEEDPDVANTRFLAQSEELWEALEASGWLLQDKIS